MNLRIDDLGGGYWRRMERSGALMSRELRDGGDDGADDGNGLMVMVLFSFGSLLVTCRGTWLDCGNDEGFVGGGVVLVLLRW